MAPEIVSRSQWGATPWRGAVYHIDIEARDYFFNHYHGGTPRYDKGAEMAKEIENIHLANGWVGVGYGFMIGVDGVAFEGRGWELVGAHCPNFNTRGMSVYYSNDGKEPLTDAQKITGRWFRDEHKRRRGNKELNTTVHGDHYPTACAGPVVNKWVKVDGMWVPDAAPVPVPATPVKKPSAVWRPSPKLVVDGRMGENTVRALQTNLVKNHGYRLRVDGDIGPATTRAVQTYLNRKLGGTDLVVDGLGLEWNLRESYGPTKTVRALQRWLGSPVDGVLSYPSSLAVRRLQDRLNRGNF